MTAPPLPAYVTDQHTDNGHGFCTCCGAPSGSCYRRDKEDDDAERE